MSSILMPTTPSRSRLSMHGNMSSVSTLNDLSKKCADFTGIFDVWVEKVQNLKLQHTADFEKQYQADSGTFFTFND
jgi:hypothetical protein